MWIRFPSRIHLHSDERFFDHSCGEICREIDCKLWFVRKPKSEYDYFQAVLLGLESHIWFPSLHFCWHFYLFQLLLQRDLSSANYYFSFRTGLTKPRLASQLTICPCLFDLLVALSCSVLSLEIHRTKIKMIYWKTTNLLTNNFESFQIVKEVENHKNRRTHTK